MVSQNPCRDQPIGMVNRHVIKEMNWVFVLPPFTLQKEWLKIGYAVHHRQTLAMTPCFYIVELFFFWSAHRNSSWNLTTPQIPSPKNMWIHASPTRMWGCFRNKKISIWIKITASITLWCKWGIQWKIVHSLLRVSYWPFFHTLLKCQIKRFTFSDKKETNTETKHAYTRIKKVYWLFILLFKGLPWNKDDFKIFSRNWSHFNFAWTLKEYVKKFLGP